MQSTRNKMLTIPSEVIQNFAAKNGLPDRKASELFSELEAFLSQASNLCVTPTKEIDEAWHEFILHTKLYAEYCFERFGRFIHHVPEKNITGSIGTNKPSDCSNCSSDCSMH
jgi:hypothetical protein